jgi:hypothetical protein
MSERRRSVSSFMVYRLRSLMSLASDFAAAVASGQASVVTAAATRPAPFSGGAGGTLEVTDTGGLKATPPTGASSVEVPGAAVPSIITWLTTTFT